MLFSLYFFLIYSYLFLSNASAYNWKFLNNPRQCSTLSVEIEGNGGQAPYNMLLIPYGPAPGQYETRTTQTMTFNSSDDGRSLDFTLNYPVDSEFVAVVSDRNGFATGGTSDVWKVRGSNDNSCFENTRTIRPKWPYFYLSTDGLRSCEASRVYWNSSNPNITGTVNFVGVIPHGTSFNITTAPLYDVPNNLTGTTGFNFTPPVTPGTNLILMSGDEAATGTGGQVAYIVAPPQDPSHTNCVPNMPSVTAGLAAGGDPSVDLDAKQSNNTGAIVGGVVGGIAFLLCVGIGLYICLRHQRNDRMPSRSSEIDPKLPTPFTQRRVSPSYEVTPFEQQAPNPPPRGQSAYYDLDGSTGNTPQSGGSDQPFFSQGNNLSTTPILSPNRKYISPPVVNYVRHTDAEDVMTPPPAQTVELPPAYNPNRPRHTSSRSSGSGGVVGVGDGSGTGTSTTGASTMPLIGDQKQTRSGPSRTGEWTPTDTYSPGPPSSPPSSPKAYYPSR